MPASAFSPIAIFRRLVLRIGLCVVMALGLIGAMSCGFAASASATPALVIDVASGDVLFAQEATRPWYPASLTKLMTFYVALEAVRNHKLTLDTPIVMSRRAAAAAPSKMGFAPGTEVTLGNALKMMVVKSANDLAIAIAEGVSGSVEAFAEDMNTTAAQLGMRQSHFVNPNGLPDPEHISSARDLAVLARAIYVNYPQEAEWFGIGALRLGDEIVPTHNNVLGRYPGADGMKTGFTCAAGFNLVTSVRRDGHHYVAVVLGAPTVKLRMLKTAVLLDRAFDGIDHPIGTLDSLEPSSFAEAPDMHNQVCRGRAKASAAFAAEIKPLEAPLLAARSAQAPTIGLGMLAPGAAPPAPVAPTIAMMPAPVFSPISVYLGPAPGYQGPVAQARPPHSPVGTEPPPEAASAYAEPKPAETAAPLKPDPNALPMKIAHHRVHKAAKVAKAAKAHHKPTIAKRKTETVDVSAATPAKKGKAKHLSQKNHPAKLAHSGKPAKTAAVKKHLAKHAAASPANASPAKPAGAQ